MKKEGSPLVPKVKQSAEIGVGEISSSKAWQIGWHRIGDTEKCPIVGGWSCVTTHILANVLNLISAEWHHALPWRTIDWWRIYVQMCQNAAVHSFKPFTENFLWIVCQQIARQSVSRLSSLSCCKRLMWQHWPSRQTVPIWHQQTIKNILQ